MVRFEVKNRFSGAVQFVAKIECDEGASLSLKLGLAVRWAIKNGANLEFTNLRGAYLEGAYLGGANLEDANLRGAHGVNDYIKSMHLEEWPISYTATHMQIGCGRHEISEWRHFNDDRILGMDGRRALKFWRKFKDHIFATIEICPAQPTKLS